ncbi:uncharacterized protein LOC135236011 isoform X2 [Anguilla rostrata]
MDVSHVALLLLVLVCMVSHSAHINFCCGKTYPESPVLVLGQSFTATCVLSEDGMRETGATAKDVFWEFRNTRVPEELYTRINDSTVSVTVNVTRELENPLKCNVLARSPSNMGIRNVHCLFFTVGYPPEKPDNLSCIVLQSGKGLSPIMTCFWNPGERDPILNTTYTLLVETIVNGEKYRAAARRDRGSVVFRVYPMFTVLNISVEVENPLGKVRSDAVILDSEDIVKTDPPKNVEVVSEEWFPTSLLVRWEHPIEEVYITLKYNIRYCPTGAHMWSQVPPSDLVGGIKSFRLQYLEPYTDYVVQVRCMQEEGHGYWSEWSRNVSTRTSEAKPSSAPDLCRIITSSKGSPERCVRLIWKTYPESPVLEVGQSFTATCVLSEDGMRETGATAKDVFWEFRNTRVPEELYTRINDSTVSVTVNVTRELENPLKCNVLARSPSNMGIRNVHCLFFTVGYPPEKPDNLSCIVLQSGKGLSPIMTCFWNPGERDPILNTTYTLLVETIVNGEKYRAAARRDRGSVVFRVYPMFTVLNISVEVENPLGKVRSDVVILDSEYIVKTDPPNNVEVVSEEGFPTSLLVRWEHPIEDVYITLKYNIRYCPAGAHMWSQVPPSDSVGGIKSFRLQYLEPYTDYVVQVRCMHEEGHGYWSEWSRNVSTRTPEATRSA